MWLQTVPIEQMNWFADTECVLARVSKFKWTVMDGKMIVLALWEHLRCALHVC